MSRFNMIAILELFDGMKDLFHKAAKGTLYTINEGNEPDKQVALLDA